MEGTRRLSPLVLTILTLFASPVVRATTYTVNSAADPAPGIPDCSTTCTLRDALSLAGRIASIFGLLIAARLIDARRETRP